MHETTCQRIFSTFQFALTECKTRRAISLVLSEAMGQVLCAKEEQLITEDEATTLRILIRQMSQAEALLVKRSRTRDHRSSGLSLAEALAKQASPNNQ